MKAFAFLWDTGIFSIKEVHNLLDTVILQWNHFFSLLK